MSLSTKLTNLKRATQTGDFFLCFPVYIFLGVLYNSCFFWQVLDESFWASLFAKWWKNKTEIFGKCIQTIFEILLITRGNFRILIRLIQMNLNFYKTILHNNLKKQQQQEQNDMLNCSNVLIGRKRQCLVGFPVLNVKVLGLFFCYTVGFLTLARQSSFIVFMFFVHKEL